MQLNTAAGSAPEWISRRSVLRGAAGVGAAGLTVTALAGTPALAASPVLKPAASTPHPAAELTAAEAVVVHVRDLRTGQMDVYRGTSHVRVHDRRLAAQLARVSQ
jgi:hypothetical protein